MTEPDRTCPRCHHTWPAVRFGVDGQPGPVYRRTARRNVHCDACLAAYTAAINQHVPWRRKHTGRRPNRTTN